jgi:hypothetical protein
MTTNEPKLNNSDIFGLSDIIAGLGVRTGWPFIIDPMQLPVDDRKAYGEAIAQQYGPTERGNPENKPLQMPGSRDKGNKKGDLTKRHILAYNGVR